MMTMKRSGTRRSNASSDARSEANREHLTECFSPVCLNGNRRPPQVPENIGAGEGNRTLVFSLECCCSTIELHPRAADQLSRLASCFNLPSGGESLHTPQLST